MCQLSRSTQPETEHDDENSDILGTTPILNNSALGVKRPFFGALRSRILGATLATTLIRTYTMGFWSNSRSDSWNWWQATAQIPGASFLEIGAVPARQRNQDVITGESNTGLKRCQAPFILNELVGVLRI